ncbi:bifunctional riboflavin kinase/FAD synthetase [Eubacteriales bacterium OttesenSCG-928-G02]|nr:bifunctional riboflavin kinase/FAD synthetase [Eubacteriales bacterium OttesenSCG-928-G02]
MRILTENDLPLQEGCVLSIGNFDGVHLGHTSLLEKANELAKEANLMSVVWTFGENPKNVMQLETTVKYITGSLDKMRLLACYGSDAVFFADFNSYQNMEPDDFIQQVLIEQFNVKTVVCGFDFKFAKNRSGNADSLIQYMESCGRKCIVVQPVILDGATVSSTLIRHYIKEGDIDTASKLLGRRYSFLLPVIEGRHIGRRIGFPTINQMFPEYQLVPAYGVYVCLCEIDGILYKGVSNIGVKPTVTDKNELLCETHILDFNENMYNKEVRIFLFKLLRKEQKFSSLDELQLAVGKDIENAKKYFSSCL